MKLCGHGTLLRVSTPQKVAAFLPAVDEPVSTAEGGSLVSLEHVDVFRYTAGA
jgi:hypothetical protein